jgi:single-strand DNA-binding protein
VNTATFAGRLGRAAELRTTPGGQNVCGFSLAVDIGFGQDKKTLWVGCSLWGERAEKLAPYLTKGKPVTVSGDVALRTWDGRDGKAGAEITCNVQRITLQGAGAAEEEQPPAERRPAARQERAPMQQQFPAGHRATADFDDDIPF